jgi:maltose O-acetyltransferase
MNLRDDSINRFIRYPSAVAIRVRIARLRLLGVHIGRNCWLRRMHVPRNPWGIKIDDMVALDDEVVLLPPIEHPEIGHWQRHLC